MGEACNSYEGDEKSVGCDILIGNCNGRGHPGVRQRVFDNIKAALQEIVGGLDSSTLR
jgi:hypothetical protein